MKINSKGYKAIPSRVMPKGKLNAANARQALTIRKTQPISRIIYTTKQWFIGQSQYNLHGHKHSS
jgi:hypothetical protein